HGEVRPDLAVERIIVEEDEGPVVGREWDLGPGCVVADRISPALGNGKPCGGGNSARIRRDSRARRDVYRIDVLPSVINAVNGREDHVVAYHCAAALLEWVGGSVEADYLRDRPPAHRRRVGYFGPVVRWEYRGGVHPRLRSPPVRHGRRRVRDR